MLCYNQKTAEGDKRFLLENRNYEKNRATVIYVPFLAHKKWYNISTPKPKRTGEKKMKAFEKIIGYEKIKDELKQICDIVQNRDIYKKMGANMPNGILINGAPGLGKSLMARMMNGIAQNMDKDYSFNYVFKLNICFRNSSSDSY